MDLLLIFASSLFFLWVIRDVFFWLKVWQDSEYRLDRFLEHINRKKRKAFHPLSLLTYCKLFLFFLFFYTVVNNKALPYYHYAIIVLYIAQLFIVAKEIYFNTLKKPLLTLRATVVLFLTIGTIFLFFSLPLLDKFFWLLFIDLFICFIVAFFVFLLSFPTELYSDAQIEKATRKVRKHKKLIVIGITGSYGKSVIKEFIAHVLSKKFHVVKTHGHENTAIGIARTINRYVDDATEIFVAEMSAYKRGEIASLCRFIRPKMRVLTAINNQHLALFKTFDNIKRTNYELLESLPKSGLAVINGNNKHTFDLSQKVKKPHVLYKYFPNVKRMASIRKDEIIAYNLIHRSRFTSFDVQIKGKTIRLTTHAHHQIENLLPGIYIAYILGMKEREMKQAIASFK